MTWIRQVCVAGVLLAALSSCSISPPPIPIHDDPALLVAVAYDPHAGTGHSHPATVSSDMVTAVLRGLQLQGRDVVGALGLLGEDHGTLVFIDRTVLAGLVPHLVDGLAKASSRDLVTFHLVQRDSQRAPLITSGGMFLRGRHLYVILANGRTSPSSIQYETTYEPNTRSNPLVPIARFKFKAGFQPADTRIATSEAKKMDGWEGYLDESKVVVVDLERLAKSLPPPSAVEPAVPPGIKP
jgi:hypothetical protein